MSTSAEFQDLDDFKKAISECRSDNYETNWVLARHVDENPHEVTLGGFGNGGAEELKDALDDNCVMYAVVRFEEQIDQSSTVKFVYIHWIGKGVPFTKKGRFGIVHGSLRKAFEPFHLTVETDNVDDLDHDVLMTKIEESSGTKSKVLDVAVAVERKADRGFTDSGKGAKVGAKKGVQGFSGMKGTSGGGSLKIDDDVVQAASDVRDDSTDTNWFVAGYQDNNPKSSVICLGSGNDGIIGIQSKLTIDMAGYALLRVTDVLDDIATVKFVYIQWIGENVKPLAKAKISTHKSDLEVIFRPAHGSLFATSSDDIQESEVMDKIQSSSGSKSHVRNKEDY